VDRGSGVGGGGRVGARPAPERRAAAGDAPCAAAVLAALEPRMRSVALRVTRCASAAEDVVQNAFLKALTHLGSFRGDARISTWLHRIVVNEALMWLRRERRLAARRAPLDDGACAALPASEESSVDALVRRERERALRRGLARLRAADRELLLACAGGGETFAAHAARTGLHPAAVKTRAFRARRRLAALVEP